MPFLAANVVGAYTGGRYARRMGRAKRIVLTGMALSAGGYLLLATLGAHAGSLVTVIDMAVVGSGSA